MNISASQSQLLRQLNIKPLQARSGFFTHNTSSENLTSVSDTAGLLQQEATVLSADITLLLRQSVVTDWHIDPDATQCQLNNNILITPALTALQQPGLKQQLWILLQPLLVNDVD